MAKMLINAFEPADVRIAVQKFSGPPSYWDARQCAFNPVGKTEAQCGIEWITRFTSNLNEAAAAVDSASWTAAFTLTSMALGSANTELAGGRQDAQSVVIVITDGRPLSRWRTGIAARNLRRKARLMFVPVTRYAPLRDINHWATTPHRDNVISVPDFRTLEMPSTVNKLISDVCPTLQG